MKKLSTGLKKSALATAILGVVAGAGSVNAYEAGDIIVKVGAAHVAPSASSTNIAIDVPAIGDTGVGGVEVGDDTQLGLSLTYMLGQQYGVEVLGATPFQHNINLPILPTVNPALDRKIASTKHLPPTVTFKYFMNNPASSFQPFIGLGVNYTKFFDTKVTGSLDNAGVIDLLAGGGAINSIISTDIELDDSYGIALQTGFDYALTEEIGLSVSYYKIDIDTKATITTTSTAGAYTGPVVADVSVDIDPSVLMLALSYKF